MNRIDRIGVSSVERTFAPQVRVYSGDVVDRAYLPFKDKIPYWHNRGVKEYNSTFAEFNNAPSFDTLLADKISNASARNASTINVVDLGAGEHMFTRNFLTYPAYGSESRRLLAEKPELNLHMISLTDAKGPSEFLRSQRLDPLHEVEEVDNSQIRAEAIPYSITSTQPLRDFYNRTGIQDIDLLVSVGCLSYLQPRVFTEVLGDTIDRLAPGGEAIFADYRTFGAHMLSADGETKGSDRPIFLADRRSQYTTTISTQEIKEAAREILQNPESSNQDAMRLVHVIANGLAFEDALPYDPFNLPHHVPTIESVGPRGFLEFAVGQFLPMGEEIIATREVSQEKLAILDYLQEQNEKRAQIEYTDNSITIKKS